MEEKKKKQKKTFKLPSAYTVLLGLMVVIALITQFVPAVKPASISDVVMAPVTGMIGVKDLDIDDAVTTTMNEEGVGAALEVLKDSEAPYVNPWNTGELSGGIDVAFFILMVGGFLGVVTKTGALDAGVATIVKKLKGKEIYLIPILMILFSIGGTSYGMAEESLAFYALIVATMMAAGFDPLVGAATVLLGAGAGVLGSTVNPFATGVAISSAASVGVEISQAQVMAIGAVLWIASLAVSIYFVMKYAKKVQADKNKSLLSKDELAAANKAYSGSEQTTLELTGRRKLVLVLFAIAFVVMVLGVIPWEKFGITFFAEYTGTLTGSPLGSWWFPELAIWFGLMGIICGVVYGLKETDLVSAYINGCADMIGVALVIGISRGISFMMANTGLDLYILDNASQILNGVSGIIFANLSLVIYIGLSFLIPSTSGLATVSMPIFAPLTQSLGLNPAVMVAIFSAGCGLVNLVTPTSGVVMGGLSIAKVEYSTWLKFVGKVLLTTFVVCAIILSIAIMIL